MLFRQKELTRIKAGEITVAFRKWRRPTVVVGGSLTTSVGLLQIDSVDRIEAREITDRDVILSGSSHIDELLAELNKRSVGELFRIRFRLKGPDPRIDLRGDTELTEAEWKEVLGRLNRLDRASRVGPWTKATLEVICEREGIRAGDLAPMVGQERAPFKLNVRKLKNLGLTESLGTGYRISPRGETVLERLRDSTR